MPDLSFLLGGWNGGNKAETPAPSWNGERGIRPLPQPPLRRERGVISHRNEGSCFGVI